MSTHSNFAAKLGVELDKLISGNYDKSEMYRAYGEIPSYAEKVGAKIDREITSCIDGISIWLIEDRGR